MKAAALTHQYLTAKSAKKYDSTSYGNRDRDSHRTLIDRPSFIPNEQTAGPSSEPLARRVTLREDGNAPSVAIITRSISDNTTDPYVVYESQQRAHNPYSLFAVMGKRHGDQDDDSNLDSGVRKFYKKQDRLIDSIKEIHRTHLGLGDADEDSKRLIRKKRHIEWLIRATVVFNCSLLVAKIVAAVFSKSLSIISSVVDSAVDSASACLLFWAVRAIKKRDPYTYPGGRTRLEPIIIVILSVIMVSASVQVIYESVESVMDTAHHFTDNSTELRQIDMGPLPITVMAVTIVIKAVLSFLCFQIVNPTMRALALDHLNDVFSNIVALACGIIAAKALKGAIKTTEVVVIDPVGAILISLYIIFCWLKQLREQVRHLSGYTAEPEFLQKITWLTLNHSPLIEKIDTVRAFHFGISFLVEVELILPEAMTLKQAHDIGHSLKEKLEKLPEVELAFVHLDYSVDALQY